VRGASVSPGYWTAAGNINRDAGEWLHTGDIGEMDDTGNLYFKGRKGNVIVTAAGLNIHPEDLEEALNRQPEVRASCVISLSGGDGTGPVAPLAVLIMRESNASAAAVIERANQSLAEYQKIRHWHVWTEPDFPRTATQKVLKREVAERIKRETRDDRTRTNDEKSESPSSFIIPHSSFSSLDSLGRIELLSALEERYQIEIDEAAFTAATTVAEIEQMVRGESGRSATPYPYPNWSRKFPVTWLRVLLFYTIIVPITRMMSRMQVKGIEHLDELTGPVLFVANHVTLADHALILAALPIRLRHRVAIAMEGERLRDWLHPPAGTSRFMRLRLLAQYILVTTFFHVFPLPKQSGFRRAFAYAGACVDRGDSLLVFPEGERAPRGQMQMHPFRSGIGLLTKDLNIPVVPIKLHGLYELKRRQQYFASPGMVSVVFAEPVKFDPHDEPNTIAEELQRRLEAM
jgi:long-chain acyl-CoA synthetase